MNESAEKFDIITFGSATKDIFFTPESFEKIKDKKKFVSGEGICFSSGSKIPVKNVFLATGGGGTNTAATFAFQGYKTAYCGAVGDDIAGREIIDELLNFGINTDLVLKLKEKTTDHAMIVSGIKSDRTIFVYRGASGEMNENLIPWDKLRARWLYIAPLPGKLCRIFPSLIDFAAERKMKIAINPGACQLQLPKKVIENALKKVDVLILNQEEASLLAKISFNQERKIFKKIDEMTQAIAIMTKGGEGLLLSDGKCVFEAKASKIKVVDRTGAGDSFASGFISEYIRTNEIEKAISFGMANSVSCLQEWGAKKGLLKKGAEYGKVNVVKKCSI